MQQYHLKIVHVAITCKIHHTGANIKHHSYYKLLKGGMMLGVLICTAISEFHVQIFISNLISMSNFCFTYRSWRAKSAVQWSAVHKVHVNIKKMKLTT